MLHDKRLGFFEDFTRKMASLSNCHRHCWRMVLGKYARDSYRSFRQGHVCKLHKCIVDTTSKEFVDFVYSPDLNN